MNLLPKPLRPEVFYYTSDKSINELKEVIQKLIKDSWLLAGNFSSEDEFFFYPSFQIGVFSPRGFSSDNSNSLLSGKLYTEESTTCIKLIVRPNTFLIAIFFLIPSLVAFFIILNLLSGEGFKRINSDLLDMLYAPFFILGFCYIIKLWLRKKVVDSLSLTSKEKI